MKLSYASVENKRIGMGRGPVSELWLRSIGGIGLSLPRISCAVQAATWVKRTFALRPALNNIRKQRAEQRQFKSSQVDDMF